jgi:hypothetical protein
VPGFGSNGQWSICTVQTKTNAALKNLNVILREDDFIFLPPIVSAQTRRGAQLPGVVCGGWIGSFFISSRQLRRMG